MNEEANAEKQLYSTLSSIKKTQTEMREAVEAGENIMGKVSPRPSEKIPESKPSPSPSQDIVKEDSGTLLEQLAALSSENRRLASRLNTLITWMDKTF